MMGPPTRDAPQEGPWITPKRAVAVQGAYYLVTGVWPFVHMRSFLAVTGPKRELWLVRTVGALVAAIGAGLLTASARRRLAPETRVVALASAAGLILVEVPTVLRGRIPPVYLLDALAEAGFVFAGVLPDEDGASPREARGRPGGRG